MVAAKGNARPVLHEEGANMSETQLREPISGSLRQDEFPIEGEIMLEEAVDPVLAFVERFRVPICVLLILAAVGSFFLTRPYFSDPQTYTSITQTIDEKKTNVTAMIASSTALSAGISALPDDTGAALSDKLMDMSASLGIVLGVLYLEKYLLTVFGVVTFGGLLPIAALFAVCAVALRRSAFALGLANFAIRLAVTGIVLVLLVPASVAVTDMFDRTYQLSIEAQQAEPAAEAAAEAEAKSEEGFDIVDFIVNIPGSVADGVTGAIEGFTQQVNNLIEQFALMIVTSCVIPILVLLAFFLVAKMLLGINVSVPMGAIAARGKRLSSGWGSAARSAKDGIREAVKERRN